MLPILQSLTVLLLITACSGGREMTPADLSRASSPTTEILSNHPEPMLRFWRGYKQEGVASEDFRTKVNERLIPALGEIGPKAGLLAYLPALLPENKSSDLPDEIALIGYASAEAYQTIRSTPKGTLYGPLHFELGLFAKELDSVRKSTSSVAEPWVQDVKLGSAYVVGPMNLNWQAMNPIVQIIEANNPDDQGQLAAAKKLLEELSSNVHAQSLKGAIVLVEKKYILVLTSNKIDLQVAPDHGVGTIEFNRRAFPASQLQFGNGINTQFDM